MAIGLECGIVLTVPGVGALALAGLLGVPLGKMLLFGVLLVIPTVAISVAIMSFLFNHGWWNPERDEQEFLGADPDPLDDDGPATTAGRHGAHADDDTAAGGGVATKTDDGDHGADTADPAVRTDAGCPWFSSPPARSCDAADIHNPVDEVPVLARHRPADRPASGPASSADTPSAPKRFEKAIATGFKESGQILILTGVGGSLAATIKAAGLGDILGEYFTASTAAPLLVVWVIAAALHVAVGSVTISAITVGGHPGAGRPDHRP